MRECVFRGFVHILILPHSVFWLYLYIRSACSCMGASRLYVINSWSHSSESSWWSLPPFMEATGPSIKNPALAWFDAKCSGWRTRMHQSLSYHMTRGPNHSLFCDGMFDTSVPLNPKAHWVNLKLFMFHTRNAESSSLAALPSLCSIFNSVM